MKLLTQGTNRGSIEKSQGLETPNLTEKIARLWAAHQNGVEFVWLQEENLREASEWIFAAFSAPITIVPLSPHLPEKARENYLNQLPANKTKGENPLFAKALSVKDLSGIALKSPIPLNYLKPRSLIWVVIFTSGSSGFPKGVALTGSQLEESAKAHGSRFPQHHWLLSISPAHIGGFSILSRSFFLDLPFAIASPKAEEIFSTVKAGGIDGISLVPPQLEKLLDLSKREFFKRDFSKQNVSKIAAASSPEEKFSLPLKAILLGGAPASSDLLARAKQLPIFSTYGMTETASQFATASSPHEEMQLLPGNECFVDSSQEIFVKSQSLAAGYFQAGKLVSLPTENGFFPTGDLGVLQGSTLRILGRKSERIQTGGLKIFPSEMEEKLKHFQPALLDFAVCSIPDPQWGEAICLAIVTKTETELADKGAGAAHHPSEVDVDFERAAAGGLKITLGEDLKENVRNFLAQEFDKRLLPKHILSLPKIPRAQNGKILRKELSNLVLDRLEKR